MAKGAVARKRRSNRRALSRSVQRGLGKAPEQAPAFTIQFDVPQQIDWNVVTDDDYAQLGRFVREVAERQLVEEGTAVAVEAGKLTAEQAQQVRRLHFAVAEDLDLREYAIPADANYRPAESTDVRCGTCDYFEGGLCTMWDETVDPDYVCDEFEPETDTEDEAALLPDEMQPRDVRPPRTAGPPAPPQELSGSTLEWSAILAPEGKLTADGRAFAPGAISWRELPLTLMAMLETSEGGHIGAQVAGRIDWIWRDDAAGLIRATGVFDDSEFGREIARMVADGVLRGNSVDLAIQEYEVGARSDYFDDDGNWRPRDEAAAEEPETLEDMLDALFGEVEDAIFVVTSAVIGMSTVCPFPAFAEARIEAGASLVSSGKPTVITVTLAAGWHVEAKPKALTAAAGDTLAGGTGEALAPLTASAAGLAPLHPPAAWFENPDLSELTPLVVTDEGRLYGHAAPWGACHIAFPDVCTEAPHTATDYAYFLLKEVVTDDGEKIACGTITREAPHASQRASLSDATAHYDHTGTACADVTVGEDDYGIWVAGALRPDVDAEKVRDLRGAVLSGDWRSVDGNLELVALLAVNVPGFPVPRPKALVAAGDTGFEVVSLTAAGVHAGDPTVEPIDPLVAAKLAALRDQAAGRYDALASQVA